MQASAHEERLATRTASADLRPSAKPVRMVAAVPMDMAAVASELQKTWNREDAAEWAQAYTGIFPNYQLLIESYAKAQEVVQNHEVLDSQRV